MMIILLSIICAVLFFEPVRHFLTPSQADALMGKLSTHFGLPKPQGYYVVFVDIKRPWLFGAYMPEENILVVSVLAPRGVKRVLRHEFAHYVAYTRNPQVKPHGKEFEQALGEIEKACENFDGRVL